MIHLSTYLAIYSSAYLFISMGVAKNRGYPDSSSISNDGIFHEIHHVFWGSPMPMESPMESHPILALQVHLLFAAGVAIASLYDHARFLGECLMTTSGGILFVADLLLDGKSAGNMRF